jgi:hypothetical protein
MSKILSLEPEYVAARTVLLDAVEALAAHRRALVVVGAQAVYLRTGSAGLSVAPFTTDGDVALDPVLLGEAPLLEEAMQQRGFQLRIRRDGGTDPGSWLGTTTVDGKNYTVPVDLIVPASMLPGGKTRGARLPVHGKRAAKRSYGLEAALVDQEPMTLRGLAPGDCRSCELAVAGAAALLVAKMHKINDRLTDASRPHRLRDKDAGDVLRLIRATLAEKMAERISILADHPTAGAATRQAVRTFDELFGTPRSAGLAMAIRAVEFDVPARTVQAQLTGYARELRRHLDI